MPRRGRHNQHYRSSGQLIHTDQPSLAVVLAQGASVPHDSGIKARGDRIRVTNGGASALAAPSVSDGGAGEFDVAISGSGPWDIAVTWVGAGLSALAKGVYSRTITVTSAGAINSPLSIPVTIRVL